MNRELVERATHPAALEAIVQEMGERWQKHAISVRGEQIADVTAGGIDSNRKQWYAPAVSIGNCT